jgi:hypothetical protein
MKKRNREITDAIQRMADEAARQVPKQGKVRVLPTGGNFFLLSFDTADGAPDPLRADACLRAARANGIFLRPMGDRGLPASIRISSGTEEEMTALQGFLKTFLASKADPLPPAMERALRERYGVFSDATADGGERSRALEELERSDARAAPILRPGLEHSEEWVRHHVRRILRGWAEPLPH